MKGIFSLLLLLGLASVAPVNADTPQPNILFILADDMGYGDVGCFGQQRMLTPNIDQLARDSLVMRQAYAGSPVCAPSRCSLLTGLHSGHARIRGNMAKQGGIVGIKQGKEVRRVHLEAEDRTLAQVLGQQGYRTCLVNKWHLDGFQPTAGPLDRGFDEFYGWLTSVDSTYNPPYFAPRRFSNRELKVVAGNENKGKAVHNTDISTAEALAFLRQKRQQPFFLYLAYGAPHGPYDETSLAPYEDKDWTRQQKAYAAMMTHLDRAVGEVLRGLEQQGLRDNTLVIFASDNGAAEDAPREFFNSGGGLRGYKGQLYEGGIRVPLLVRWPGVIQAGGVTQQPCYFPDLFATLAAVAGAKEPAGIDGVSLVPLWRGEQNALTDRALYWEFPEKGFAQALRRGKWKLIRPSRRAALELYDLERDPGETQNLAEQQTALVNELAPMLDSMRRESVYWPRE